MQKSILYVRVSSKEQKQEGYSIPAQRKLLREYAKANSFAKNTCQEPLFESKSLQMTGAAPADGGLSPN